MKRLLLVALVVVPSLGAQEESVLKTIAKCGISALVTKEFTLPLLLDGLQTKYSLLKKRKMLRLPECYRVVFKKITTRKQRHAVRMKKVNWRCLRLASLPAVACGMLISDVVDKVKKI